MKHTDTHTLPSRVYFMRFVQRTHKKCGDSYSWTLTTCVCCVPVFLLGKKGWNMQYGIFLFLYYLEWLRRHESYRSMDLNQFLRDSCYEAAAMAFTLNNLIFCACVRACVRLWRGEGAGHSGHFFTKKSFFFFVVCWVKIPCWPFRLWRWASQR
jgi:hypothetical protein